MCDVPTTRQTSSASLLLTRPRPVPPPGKVAAPKAPQARCSPPGSAPSVRLEMTGSGAGGTGSQATWQREGGGAAGLPGLAPPSRPREGPPLSPSGPGSKGPLPGLRSCGRAPSHPAESGARTQYLYSEC